MERFLRCSIHEFDIYLSMTFEGTYHNMKNNFRAFMNEKSRKEETTKNLANSFDGLHKMYLVVEHFILWLNVIKSKKTRMNYNKNSLILIKTIKDFAYIFIAFILRVSS